MTSFFRYATDVTAASPSSHVIFQFDVKFLNYEDSEHLYKMLLSDMDKPICITYWEQKLNVSIDWRGTLFLSLN